jgi:hypothetical protein
MLKRLLWVGCKGEIRQDRGRPWSRLDQALRVSDLLLQVGGFAAIVLDMGDVAPEHARRIPLATWYRFRQAADQSRSSLLVLGKSGYAQSSAAVVLECLPNKEVAGRRVAGGCIFAVRLKRERFAELEAVRRKPLASTWTVCSNWSAGARP